MCRGKPGAGGLPVPRQHLGVHLVVLHETRDIPHPMAPFAHLFRPPVGVHYGRISHPGKPTPLQEELCYAPPIPIERKSCLVIPRLQHVRSLTPRAVAAVSRTDRRLTCTGTYVVSVAHST
ncbi:unnamed protein product [Microthlaspi erraticum]|uniref:Uncharacterized protein n=1 Tax=Microthlaspi erraticum TaxID=1685480 RepID=A0A6D2JKA8_9BRAS|nr:unnamed protein product [Microthlaspi erraticum]